MLLFRRILNGDNPSTLEQKFAIETDRKTVIYLQGLQPYDSSHEGLLKLLNGEIKHIPEQLLGGKEAHSDYTLLGTVFERQTPQYADIARALNQSENLIGTDGKHRVFLVDEIVDFAEVYLMPLMPANNTAESMAAAVKKLENITLMSHSYGGSTARQISLALSFKLRNAGIDVKNIHRLISSVAHIGFGSVSTLPSFASYGEPHFTTFSFAHYLDVYPDAYCSNSILSRTQKKASAKNTLEICTSSPNVAECGVWLAPNKEILLNGKKSTFSAIARDIDADADVVHAPMWLTYPNVSSTATRDESDAIMKLAQGVCNRSGDEDRYQNIQDSFGINSTYWRTRHLPALNAYPDELDEKTTKLIKITERIAKSPKGAQQMIQIMEQALKQRG
jgi:hypothetical protein